MSKKSTINEKHPTLNQEPDSAPTEGEVVVAPPPPASSSPSPTKENPAPEQGRANRPLKPGVRPSSPKALLHIPSVFA